MPVGIPDNCWNRVPRDHVTVHSAEPSAQFDVACIAFSEVYSNLGVVVEKGSCNICMFRVAVHVEVKRIGVVSGFRETLA